MSIESGTTIADLVSTNPAILDPVHDGPNHFWLIKNILKLTFPGVDGDGFNAPITALEDDLNAVEGLAAALDVGETLAERLGTVDTSITSINSTITTINNDIDALTLRLDKIYPVGSIYINASVSTNPATLLGFGTWVSFGASRVLVGLDNANSICDTPEQTGGVANTVLPSHNHAGTTEVNGDHYHTHVETRPTGVGSTGGSLLDPFKFILDFISGSTSVSGAHNHNFTTTSAGSSAVNKNYPPFITVYMWKRTA